MKRFDFANEVAKQLITIASAIITLVLAFYEKFFSHDTYFYVLAALLLFVASIFCGVLSIGGVTTLTEDQEHKDWLTANPPPGTTVPPVFVRLGGSWSQYSAMAQQGLFVIALILFTVIAIRDHLFANSAKEQAAVAPAASVPAKEAKGPVTRLSQPIVWVQLRPDTNAARGELLARAVVSENSTCPALTVNGDRWPMLTRSEGADPDFPVKMCEAAIPGNAKAELGGVALKARPSDPHKILVIGDTGCRITDYTAQLCDNATDWPFFRIAKTARAVQPDLIVHVGDYHYREKPCSGRSGCTHSPYGDNWRTWNADFFVPAAPLLTTAPWLMLRGNHEDCTRADAGWNLLIRPQIELKPGERCPADADPDVFDLGSLHLVVPDTASAEGHGPETRVLTYRKQLRDLKPTDTSDEWWLVTHQALWVSYGKDKDKGETDPTRFNAEDPLARLRKMTGDQALSEDVCKKLVDPMNTYRQWIDGAIVKKPPGKEDACAQLKAPSNPADASNYLQAPPFSLVLSGDTHTFQMFKPDDATGKKVPVQLVAGNSGDALEKAGSYPEAEKNLFSIPAVLFGVHGEVWMRHTFGFTVLQKVGDHGGWQATLYDADGKAIVNCDLGRSQAGCKQL